MNYGAVAIVLAIAAIAGAWGFQLVGGYIPCALCLEQRIPYYWGLPIAVLSFVIGTMGGPAALTRLGFLLFAAIMLWACALAVYHAGAEWEFWLGPDDCGGQQVITEDASNLLADINSVRLVSCTDAAARFFGLSFAGWNAVVTVLVAILSTMAALLPAHRSLD